MKICTKVCLSLGIVIKMTVFTLIQASKSSSIGTVLSDGHSMLWGNTSNGLLYYSALLWTQCKIFKFLFVKLKATSWLMRISQKILWYLHKMQHSWNILVCQKDFSSVNCWVTEFYWTLQEAVKENAKQAHEYFNLLWK